MPFALRIIRRPLSATTFVGYHAVGKNPIGSTAVGDAGAPASKTATAFRPAAVTYNLPPLAAHDVGALPKRADAP